MPDESATIERDLEALSLKATQLCDEAGAQDGGADSRAGAGRLGRILSDMKSMLETGKALSG